MILSGCFTNNISCVYASFNITVKSCADVLTVVRPPINSTETVYMVGESSKRIELEKWTTKVNECSNITYEMKMSQDPA